MDFTRGLFMKRLIAYLLSFILIFGVFALPVGAAEISTGVYLGVSFDKETGMVSFSGSMLKANRTIWLTYYLLNPGYDYTDIPNSDQMEVVANYGQIKADGNGDFSHPGFKYNGTEGLCKIYVTTGGTTVVKEIVAQ